MELRLVVGIIRPRVLEAVEKKLQEIGERRLTVIRSKGYGAHANFFARDWLVDQVKLEIYVEQDRAESVAAAILDTAHTGSGGGGSVAILPLDKVYNIRTRAEEIPNRLQRGRP